MSRRPSAQLRVIAVALSLAALVSGCAHTVSVNFERDRSRLEVAAEAALSVDIPASEKWTPVNLPERYSDLAVNGQADHLRRGDREFVFFAQRIEGQTSSEGLVYSADGDPPTGVLEDDAVQLSAHWWRGTLSGEYLA